jgi:hypothetical protein
MSVFGSGLGINGCIMLQKVLREGRLRLSLFAFNPPPNYFGTSGAGSLTGAPTARIVELVLNFR